jgi:HEPN domain-containing protein
MRGDDDAQRCLDQAEDDLLWAGRLQEQGGHNIACFLSQQVAEKALRALLYKVSEEPVLSHSVQNLCERAAAAFPELRTLCAHWGSLDGFYVPTRYPDALPGSIPALVYDAETSGAAVATATQVVESVRRLIQGRL